MIAMWATQHKPYACLKHYEGFFFNFCHFSVTWLCSSYMWTLQMTSYHNSNSSSLTGILHPRLPLPTYFPQPPVTGLNPCEDLVAYWAKSLFSAVVFLAVAFLSAACLYHTLDLHNPGPTVILQMSRVAFQHQAFPPDGYCISCFLFHFCFVFKLAV